jgi:hypothetical protein
VLKLRKAKKNTKSNCLPSSVLKPTLGERASLRSTIKLDYNETLKELQENRVNLFLSFSQISFRDQEISMIAITRWKNWVTNTRNHLREDTLNSRHDIAPKTLSKPFLSLLRLFEMKRGICTHASAPCAQGTAPSSERNRNIIT